MTLGVTQDVLDRWVAQSPSGGGCNLPGCGCQPRPGIALSFTCHPDAGVRVHTLDGGTVILGCRRGQCRSGVQHIAVTDALPNGPVHAPCHPKAGLKVAYLVGGDLIIRCQSCFGTVARYTVAPTPPRPALAAEEPC